MSAFLEEVKILKDDEEQAPSPPNNLPSKQPSANKPQQFGDVVDRMQNPEQVPSTASTLPPPPPKNYTNPQSPQSPKSSKTTNCCISM